MNYWVVNTDESEEPGKGADKKMLLHSRVAAWKDPNEDPGWALRKLAKPEAGDRVFLYKKGIGVIAMATFDHSEPYSSDDIFGMKHMGEFSRPIVDLRTAACRSLSCSEIEKHTGRSFRPLQTVFQIKVPEIASFLEQSFDKR